MNQPRSIHGPLIEGGGVTFRLFAPDPVRVELVLFHADGRERARMPMRKNGSNWTVHERVPPGALYAFSPDGRGPFPDPASRHQPRGVHGPSAVVDPTRFRFVHDAPAIDPRRVVLYELHVGAVTPKGTFESLVERLDYLRDLGVNTLELMPIAEFNGTRNWGYDGVLWFAPAHSYGSPEALVRLIDAAHARGLAIVLDVVFNHFGPAGNYLREWGKGYFTDRQKTPWGDAINYSLPEVRALALEAATSWIRDYRFDGLRLDATHAIYDESKPHLLEEVARMARESAGERRVAIFAEDERNEAALARSMGVDAIWADDFHHEVRRIVAGDDEAWFADFQGDLDELVRILDRGWLYEGQPKKNGTPRGTKTDGLDPSRFVHCIQNHDQVGNRALGDRLHHVVDSASYRAATALLLASPYVPLLFMGQEFGASTPFTFFTHHDEELGKLVTKGRREEFANFRAFSDEGMREHIPDPQDEASFARSRLHWAEAEQSPGSELLALHRRLLSLRNDPAMRGSHCVARVAECLVAIRREHEGRALVYVVGLREGGTLDLDASPLTRGVSVVELDTEGSARLEGRRLTLAGPGAVVLR